jgi:hypothetical protein
MPDTNTSTSVKQPAPPIDPAQETAKIEPGGEGPIGPNDGPNITKGTERGAPGAPGKPAGS